jgi:hypothetical protein
MDMPLPPNLLSSLVPPPDYVPLAALQGTTDEQHERTLRDAIAVLHQRVQPFSSHEGFQREYLGAIADAEAHLKRKEWSNAAQAVWEATFLVNRAIESTSKQAEVLRVTTVAYLFLWLAGAWFVTQYYSMPAAGVSEWLLGGAYWRYILMGILGGVSISFWGIFWHTVQLDFDCRYWWWYLLKPILGGVAGLMTVLIIQAGLWTLQPGKVNLQNRLPLYVVAFLAGFSERIFMRVTDRVMCAIFGADPAIPPTKPQRRRTVPVKD